MEFNNLITGDPSSPLMLTTDNCSRIHNNREKKESKMTFIFCICNFYISKLKFKKKPFARAGNYIVIFALPKLESLYYRPSGPHGVNL